MADRTKTIVLVDDRFWKSFFRDIWTAVVLCGLTMLGWWVGSPALQWIGGFFAVLFIVGRAVTIGIKNQFTISEARAELERIAEERA